VPTLPYHVVDVFTDRPYAGNPLAVVLGADDLPTAALQSMAREFNLSETAFPMASRVADYRVRIFTPYAELPFAGHPSIGTAWLLAKLGRIPAGAVRQECAAGIMPVEVGPDGAAVTGGAVTAGPPLDPEPLLGAAGLDAAALSGLAPTRTAGAGRDWTFLPVTDDAVTRAVPDWATLRRVSPATGLAVFSWADGTAHLRALVEQGFEDPATGSAALGLGAYLAASGLVGDGSTAYRIAQGAEIGRSSILHGTVEVTAGRVTSVTVRGGVVPVATGEISPPA
jgi:trans-2,3-dihydro-3-hydroxyanthranilate isomerase